MLDRLELLEIAKTALMLLPGEATDAQEDDSNTAGSRVGYPVGIDMFGHEWWENRRVSFALWYLNTPAKTTLDTVSATWSVISIF